MKAIADADLRLINGDPFKDISTQLEESFALAMKKYVAAYTNTVK